MANDKNNVEMIVSAKDATGPGLDSAQRKIGKFGKDIDRDLVGSAIKFGAAVQGLQGGFTLLSAGIAAFSGDSEAAGAALERLPLGIGGVIRELNGLAEAFDAGRKRAIEFQKALNDIQDMTSADRKRVSLIGETGLAADIGRIDMQEQAEVAKLQKEQSDAFREEMAKLGLDEARELSIQRGKRIDIIRQGYEAERELARQAAAKRDEERVADFEKERAAFLKQVEEVAKIRMREAMERERLLGDGTGAAAAQRFRQMADFANILSETQGGAANDFAAIDDALKAARNNASAASLPSGTQSRFGTGLAASAREAAARMATETATNTAKTVEKLEKIRKLLEDANKPPAVPGINIEILEGLT